MSGVPWDQPGADPLGDLNRALKAWADAPYRPHTPLLSPRCGLEGHIRPFADHLKRLGTAS